MTGRRRWLSLAALAAVLGGVVLGESVASVLRICDWQLEPSSLNPTQVFDAKTDTILHQMLEGLVQFQPDGKLEPALAVSWERLDPLRMRFQLRAGVRFHNGEPMDAESVRFSFATYLDPATRFPGYAVIRNIARVDVEGPGTVVVVTHSPDSLLLSRLAGVVRILPRAYYEKVGPQDFAGTPVGTGPFRFSRRVPGKFIALEANRDYWRKGYPLLTGLEFHFLPFDRQLGALLKGEVDLITELPGTRTIDVARNPRTRVLKNSAFWTIYGSMNTTRKPLSDLRVRQALNYALDRGELIRLEAMGNGRPVASLSMQGEAGHNPELAVYPYDPARARRLLKEAGYPKGFELQLLSVAARAAQVVAGQFAEIGVRVRVIQTDAAQMIGDVARLKPDIFLTSCPDPLYDASFIEWAACSSESPFSVVRDPVFDKKLGEVATTLDPTSRDKLARELDAYIHDQALCLFTFQRVRTLGLDRRVQFVPSLSDMHRFMTTSFSASASTAGFSTQPSVPAKHGATSP
ncbi:MAG: ABC transporter substrate-binding protein [Candidatus Wallbacteria bacterium]|nr:ABC transporter substrate-binding protein [Candidatus Wallbacteria bacterium]